MNLTDSRLAQAGNERLELAMLSFFEQFRKIYIGDQVQKSSKVKQQPSARGASTLKRSGADLTWVCVAALSATIGGAGTEQRDDGAQRLHREDVSAADLRARAESGRLSTVVFASSSITNLKYWGQCEPITSKTLQLLNDLSLGYPC